MIQRSVQQNAPTTQLFYAYIVLQVLTYRNIELDMSNVSWALHVGFGTCNTHRRYFCRTQMRIIQTTKKPRSKLLGRYMPSTIKHFWLKRIAVSINIGYFARQCYLSSNNVRKKKIIGLSNVKLFKSYPSRLLPSKSWETGETILITLRFLMSSSV